MLDIEKEQKQLLFKIVDMSKYSAVWGATVTAAIHRYVHRVLCIWH